MKSEFLPSNCSRSTTLEIFNTNVDEIELNQDQIDIITRLKICRCGIQTFPKKLLSLETLRTIDLSENNIEIFKVENFSSLNF